VGDNKNLTHGIGFNYNLAFHGSGEWPSLSAPPINHFDARFADYGATMRMKGVKKEEERGEKDDVLDETHLAVAHCVDGIDDYVGEPLALIDHPSSSCLLSCVSPSGNGPGLELKTASTAHSLTAPLVILNTTHCAEANVAKANSATILNYQGAQSLSYDITGLDMGWHSYMRAGGEPTVLFVLQSDGHVVFGAPSVAPSDQQHLLVANGLEDLWCVLSTHVCVYLFCSAFFFEPLLISPSTTFFLVRATRDCV
jgi:hypothetical protein